MEDPKFREIELRDAIHVWMAKLPAEYRLVLTLFYLRDRSYQEVVDITGFPMGTVKTYLHRARRHLRKYALQESSVL